jgi:hypothetical protein
MTPVVVAKPVNPSKIALDDSYVYYGDMSASKIMKVPIAGGAPVTLATNVHNHGSSGKSVGSTGDHAEAARMIGSQPTGNVMALRRRSQAVAPCSLASRLSATLRPAARAPSAALTRAARGA